MPAPFFILSLPRSRSAWLKHFLSYRGRMVGHDLAIECTSMADFFDRVSKLDGTCETGSVIGWRLIRKTWPESKIVVVKRPVADVIASLSQFGIIAKAGELEARAGMLEACAASRDVVTVDFADLRSPHCCKWIFEYLLELEFDWQWWEQMDKINIQVDMVDCLARLWAKASQLEALKYEIDLANRGLDCSGLN